GLLRSTDAGAEASDAYIRAVAQSPQLEVVREIVLQWRVYDVRRTCILTARLLDRRNLLGETVRAFARQRRISPFVDAFGGAFLEEMGRHEDRVVAAVAWFELALLKVKRGDPGEYVVDWEEDPYGVLSDLLGEAPADETRVRGGLHRTVISHKLPDLFAV